MAVKSHAQCLPPGASPCHAILLILTPRYAATTCTPGFWLSPAGQWFETRKFSPQTRLGRLYFVTCNILGFSRQSVVLIFHSAYGSSKLISNMCLTETCSTVHLRCVANAGIPRSQWICGHWIQCLPPQIDSSRAHIIYPLRDRKLVVLKNHRTACIGKDF